MDSQNGNKWEPQNPNLTSSLDLAVIGRAGVDRAVLSSDLLFDIKVISNPAAKPQSEQSSIPEES